MLACLVAVSLGIAAAAAAPTNITSERKCFYDGAWGDVCRYKNICFLGSPNRPMFISDDKNGFHRRAGPSNYIFATTKLFRTIEGLPDPLRAVPLYAFRTRASLPCQSVFCNDTMEYISL